MALPRMLRRLLPGDEVLIAGVGLGAAAIIACAGGALWWLTAESERQMLSESREAMLDVLSDSMGHQVAHRTQRERPQKQDQPVEPELLRDAPRANDSSVDLP